MFNPHAITTVTTIAISNFDCYVAVLPEADDCMAETPQKRPEAGSKTHTYTCFSHIISHIASLYHCTASSSSKIQFVHTFFYPPLVAKDHAANHGSLNLLIQGASCDQSGRTGSLGHCLCHLSTHNSLSPTFRAGQSRNRQFMVPAG